MNGFICTIHNTGVAAVYTTIAAREDVCSPIQIYSRLLTTEWPLKHQYNDTVVNDCRDNRSGRTNAIGWLRTCSNDGNVM